MKLKPEALNRLGRTVRTFAAAIASFAICASGANAAPTTLIYLNSSGFGDLYSYDAGNGFAETLVASATGAFSISSGPLANTIYLQVGGALSTYDLLSSVTTPVGGAIPGNSLGEGRDGFLYAGSGTGLSRVDPGTGLSTFIGNGANGYAGDIAVDPTDLTAMYGAVSVGNDVALVRIDKATGAQTIVGSFNLGVGASIYGIGFSLDGTLYAAGPSGAGGEIYEVDKLTGAATAVHSIGYQPLDMATQPFDTNEPGVPEPASLALLGLGLAGLGFSRRRKA